MDKLTNNTQKEAVLFDGKSAPFSIESSIQQQKEWRLIDEIEIENYNTTPNP